MANPSPHKARMAKRKRAQAGDLEQLRAKLWNAIEKAEQFLDSEEATTVFRAVNAIAQAAAPYLKTLEVGEHEERLKAIEEAQWKGAT